MSHKGLNIGNDTLVELAGLRDESTGEYLTDQSNVTITGTLKDADGNEVDGQGWPAAFAYYAGSVTLPNGAVVTEGNWRVVLQDTLELTENATYELHVSAVDSLGGGKGSWVVDYLARERGDR